jgi:hypothetical protein
MMVPPEELSRVEEMLQDASVTYKTHIEDVQE